MKSKKNYCAVFHIGVPVKYVNFRFFLQNHHVYLIGLMTQLDFLFGYR